MKWGERETFLFTKIYLKHPCLWDTRHTFYRQKDRKRSAYREMIAEFYDACGIQLAEAEVQIKLKSLRSTYSQELQKIRVRSNPEWKYVPTLKWFHIWHKTIGPTKARDSRALDESFGDDQNDDSVENIESGQEQVWVSSQEDIEVPLTTETDLDMKPELLTPELTRFKSKKRKFRDRNISSDSDRNDRLFDRQSFSSSRSETKDDEFDIYGKYIATQLRKMDIQKALRIQLEIQSLVSEARISDMNDG